MQKDPRAGRFLREAELLEKLDHPNIVEYVAHGIDPDGTLFLATEWLDGESLADVLARGPLSTDDCVALARSVAAGLGAAHAMGVVHRDVKPSNVFLRGKILAG